MPKRLGVVGAWKAKKLWNAGNGSRVTNAGYVVKVRGRVPAGMEPADGTDQEGAATGVDPEL